MSLRRSGAALLENAKTCGPFRGCSAYLAGVWLGVTVVAMVYSTFATAEAAMSIRARLYEAIAKLPDRDPVTRIVATGEFLDSLPADEAEVAARRLLALTIAYEASLTDMKGTLEEFFERVDEIDTTLLN